MTFFPQHSVDGVPPVSPAGVHGLSSAGTHATFIPSSTVALAKVAFVTLFNGERILCDRIFSTSSSSSSVSIAESTFIDITLPSALKLFVFPITVAKCRKTAEKIFPTLDVYQTILHVIPQIEQIFSYDSTASVRSQAAESLEKLGESVNAMMIEFQSSITKESSKSPIPGGGVHQLTRYVMNFIVFLADYSDSLTVIIKDKESSLPLPEDYYNNEENPENAGSPMAARLAWLILVLLCKIDAKSRLYSDAALSYLFLANNLHYVLIKVRTSNLKVVLGDDWVANHEVKVTQYLEKYEKMAWGDVIASLPGVSTAAAKAEEALRRFNKAFEETYKKHKNWVVPDPKLRDEIKASIASKLMGGYTGFYKEYPIRDWHGAESKEQRKFMEQYERQQEVEEELFARAPRTKEDKKREKRLKSRSGLHGLTESFDDEFKFLDEDGEKPSSFGGSGRKSGGRSKRRKTRH
ncbi:hypothetical protein F2Q70_00019589 [Brassica cretica]|uniref:Exocyst subunit Exo70 family protein n=1 Tax=Brassica cretica TaxID=69181 RepID=A0A8S9GTE8_BRACR|nr:hypothetical protein F2Q70_00019589 [Brassica cretica]